MRYGTRLSVVHFSTADVVGGAARSAYRIHSGLRQRGYSSRMLVGFKASQDPDVDTVSGRRWLRLADRAVDKLAAAVGAQYLWLPSSHRTVRHEFVRHADIVQLYNIHGGYFSQWLLPHLARMAPLVWRLSDQWPMTGHCAYSGDCQRWLMGCGNCPLLSSYPPIGIDTSAALFSIKRKLYQRSPMTIVAPSSWMAECAKKSALLGRFPIVVIPNGVDGDIFRPRDRASARRQLGLPEDARVILFCAHILDNNVRKGGDQLAKAINGLPADEKRVLALVGEGGESWQSMVSCHVKLLGYQSEADRLALCYAAADLVAIPSLLENLPNTLIEALACGRPVVAIDSGGIRDGVIDGVTGLLVKPDAEDLAKAIQLLLTDAPARERMGSEARRFFERDFSRSRELDRLEALYGDLNQARCHES